MKLNKKPRVAYNGKTDGWEYVFFDEEGNAINHPVNCKDYLLDWIWSEKTGLPINIYDYSYTPCGFIKEREYLYLGITKTKTVIDKELLEQYRCNCQKLINLWEDILKFNYTATFLDEGQTDIIFKFSVDWLVSPHMFSFLTLLMRYGMMYDGNLEAYLFSNKYKECETNDKFGLLAQQVKEYLESLIRGEKMKEQKWEDIYKNGVKNPGREDFYNIHYSGLQSFLCRQTR